MATEPRHRPAVSDIALALATRQPREKSTETTITNDNAKHVPHTTVKVTDPDSEESFGTAVRLFKLALAEFGDPRQNGEEK
jgi:hypothetical protein